MEIVKKLEIQEYTETIGFKLVVIIVAIAFALFASKMLSLSGKIDPVLLNGVLFTGFFILVYALLRCIDNKIIPYFLLQYTNIWIFLNQDLFSPFGLDIKPHALVFGISLLITGYYLLKNFKYLWSYWPFRLLFIFFILNIFYALFYSSDFRSSNYIDLWIQNNVGLKHTSIGSGYGAASRDFSGGETKFLKYLAGLTPIVAFAISYMSLYGLKSLEHSRKKFLEIIHLFSFGYLAYFALMNFCILLGTCSVMFMENRLTIDKGFTGGDFEGLLLLLFIGFYYYLSSNSSEIKNKFIKPIIQINIAVLSLLIILGIKKGTILSFLAGFLVIKLCSFVDKDRNKLKEKAKNRNNVGILLLILAMPLIIALPIFIFSNGIIDNLAYNISHRFSSTDTLDVRATNWYYYLKYWSDNLNYFTALFGFGIDTSRETVFFLSAMHPDKSMQQPHIHNIYLEMFYNYGLVALLYFLPSLIIGFKDVLNLLNKTISKDIKLFSSVSIATIIFFFMFYTAESPAMPTNIIYFGFLGFLESLKNAFKNN